MDHILDPALVTVGLSLAVGLLIGLERGWSMREGAEGTRVAGLRTFGLIGLLGGLGGLVSPSDSAWLIAGTLLVLGYVLTMAYRRHSRQSGDFGITTIVAALITFVLGVAVSIGLYGEAVAGAVITAVVLWSKQRAHHFLEHIDRADMQAALRFAILTAVILPALPNRTVDPWGVINPFEFWLMVVLISGLGFAGYVASRVFGARYGLLSTALAGSLVSSTAVTLSFSRVAKRHSALAPILVGGIIMAATVMIARVLLVVALLAPSVAVHLALPVAAMVVIGGLWAGLLIRKLLGRRFPEAHSPTNPLELKMALVFAVVLAGVSIIAHFSQQAAGDMGIYGLATVVGLADVDALILTVSRMVAGESEPSLGAMVGATAIMITMVINTLVKPLIALVVAGREAGQRVAGAIFVIAGAGVAVFVLQRIWLG